MDVKVTVGLGACSIELAGLPDCCEANELKRYIDENCPAIKELLIVALGACQSPPSGEARVLDEVEAGDFLSLTPRQVKRLASRGELAKIVYPNCEVRFDQRELVRFVELHRVPECVKRTEDCDVKP